MTARTPGVHRPAPTARTAYSPARGGTVSWCPTCQAYRPARQVAAGAERRDRLGRITATYAAVPHTADGMPA